MKHYAIQWNLESIIKRKKLTSVIADLDKALHAYKKKKLLIDGKVLALQAILSQLAELESYIDCLIVQDVADQDAKQKKSLILEKQAAIDTELLKLTQELVTLSDSAFQEMLSHKKLEHLGYFLTKLRTFAKEKASFEIEELCLKLSLDGFHSWYGMYQELIGGMRIHTSLKGRKLEELSAAEADNLLSNPERTIRKEVFTQWAKACENEKMRFAIVLNHIAGFRLKLCAERKWESPLKEPLHNNNMEEKTLEAMWQAVKTSKNILKPFYDAKAKICGVKKLSWYDLEAPLEKNAKKRSYQAFAESFPNQLAVYSPDMEKYAKNALEKAWLDVEARQNKAPGGFCAPLPESKESRIYLSHSGSFHNDLVVAHELGHGYHSHIVFSLPYFAQKYPMNLAEMASTFFEHITIEALSKGAKNKKIKKQIVFEKVQRHTFLLQNIYARFVFEESLYEKRKQGFILPDELSSMMEEAQKSAYGDIFETYHPHFWITKLHFYLTDISFYNFPYTIGYLLSLLLMQAAQQDPKSFDARYKALLLDTARLGLKNIVRIHFSGNSEDPKFWMQALDIVSRDVAQLMELI